LWKPSRLRHLRRSHSAGAGVRNPAQRSLGCWMRRRTQRYGRQIDSTILTAETALPAARLRWSSFAPRVSSPPAPASRCWPAATASRCWCGKAGSWPPPSTPNSRTTGAFTGLCPQRDRGSGVVDIHQFGRKRMKAALTPDATARGSARQMLAPPGTRSRPGG